MKIMLNQGLFTILLQKISKLACFHENMLHMKLVAVGFDRLLYLNTGLASLASLARLLFSVLNFARLKFARLLGSLTVSFLRVDLHLSSSLLVLDLPSKVLVDFTLCVCVCIKETTSKVPFVVGLDQNVVLGYRRSEQQEPRKRATTCCSRWRRG